MAQSDTIILLGYFPIFIPLKVNVLKKILYLR